MTEPAAEPAHKRRVVVGPTLFALVAFAILVGLGWWQLQRKAWKDDLTAHVTQRLSGPPAAGIPARDSWSRLDRDEFEYQRVTLSLEFSGDEEALVYTSGSAFRPDVTGPGYWVFSPARLLGGSTVVVNRGFIPFDKKDPAARREGTLKGIHEVVGVLHWPEARGLFTPADDPAKNVWYTRDANIIAQAKGWGPVAPFFIELEQPQVAGGLPKVGPFVVKLSNNHWQYAMTWFGLALTLVGVYFAWLRSRRRAR